MPLAAPLFLLLLSAAPCTDPKRLPDRVELANGQKLEGRVVYQDEAELILRKGTRDQSFELKDIARVFSRAQNHDELLERWVTLGDADIRGILDVASSCDAMDLKEEAALLRWRLLLHQPRLEDAHIELGHSKREGVWQLAEGGRWTSVDAWIAAHKDWKTAWELESTHWKLKSDVALVSATESLLDLECLYHAFFRQYGHALHAYEVTEKIQVQICAQRENFPDKSPGRLSLYDVNANIVFLDGSQGVSRFRLFQEGTRALLASTGLRERVTSGVVPPWIDMGLSARVAANMQGEPGHAAWKPALWEDMVQRVAYAFDGKTPPRLGRLLICSVAEFDEHNLDRYAQAYTLVDFCLSAAGERYRLRFLEYLRNTYRGKGAAPQLYETLRTSEEELERDWLAYVRKCSAGLAIQKR